MEPLVKWSNRPACTGLPSLFEDSLGQRASRIHRLRRNICFPASAHIPGLTIERSPTNHRLAILADMSARGCFCRLGPAVPHQPYLPLAQPTIPSGFSPLSQRPLIRHGFASNRSSQPAMPRLLHTSRPRLDHYKTLRVERHASQKEIKAQFYALSKKYHPDLHPDDEAAKKKFQEVSEAWTTLGHEQTRRQYDRQLRSGFVGASGGGGVNTAPAAGYHYDASDNASRRARATYAWEYQRRRSDSNRARAGASRYPPSGGYSTSGGGSGSSAQSTMFEEYAARQRRREEFVSSRNGGGGSSGSGGAGSSGDSSFTPNSKEHEAHAASPIFRFLQVTGMFAVVYTVGAALTSGSGEPKRRRPM
ncbi:unnamed protein product [Parajaminaea phylloscopi]